MVKVIRVFGEERKRAAKELGRKWPAGRQLAFQCAHHGFDPAMIGHQVENWRRS
jgi:hypothetical protein